MDSNNMRMLGQNLVKLEKFDGFDYNTWRRDMLFMLDLMGIDEALIDLCPIVDESQSLRAVQIAEATRKRWTMPIPYARV